VTPPSYPSANTEAVVAGLPSKKSSNSEEQSEKELRIGLVLYGGVSLAIYISGVTAEFLRLVRYKGTAYQPLLERLGILPRIDVVSGSSAGGINGLFLAKALATGARMDGLKELWIRRGDAETLLDGLGSRKPARSLFDSNYYVDQLKMAFSGMVSGSAGKPDSPCMDAFITVTDLEGMTRVFPGFEGLEAKQFCQTFHLKARPENYLDALQNGVDRRLQVTNVVDAQLSPEPGRGRNDFSGGDSLLARIAAATSAFPVAFEPALFTRDSIEGLVRFPDGDIDRKEIVFADGGMVDNKPFSYTIQTIFSRQASRPVDRKLVYVEPDPTGEIRAPTSRKSGDRRPADGFDSLIRFISAKLGETIANDLDEIQRQNARIETVRKMLARLEECLSDEIGKFRRERGASDFRAWIFEQPMHRPYQELKSRLLVRHFVDHVREYKFLGGSAEFEALFEAESRREDFLPTYDYLFRIRRLRYFIRKVNRALKSEAQSDRVEDLCRLKTILYVFVEFYEHGAWRAFESAGNLEELRSAFQRLMTAAHLSMMEQLSSEITDLGLESAIRLPNWMEIGALGKRSGEHSQIDFFCATYELIDMYTFPAVVLAEIGEADPIEVIRVSPADDPTFGPETFLDKIAGEKLGHFSAFMKQSWRENDILWGRLDAAERIVRRLLRPEPAGTDPELDSLVEETLVALRNEIVEEELTSTLERRRSQQVGATATGDGGGSVFDRALETIREKISSGKGLIKLLVEDYSVGREDLSNVDQSYLWRTTAKASRILGRMFTDHRTARGLARPSWILRLIPAFPYAIAVSLGGAEKSRRAQLRNFALGLFAVITLAHLAGLLTVQSASVWATIFFAGIWWSFGAYTLFAVLLSVSFLLSLSMRYAHLPSEGGVWKTVQPWVSAEVCLGLGLATLLCTVLVPLSRWLVSRIKSA